MVVRDGERRPLVRKEGHGFIRPAVYEAVEAIPTGSPRAKRRGVDVDQHLISTTTSRIGTGCPARILTDPLVAAAGADSPASPRVVTGARP
eukprot:gene6824-9292_t